mmetsp:Transcript_24514/g.58094  ORF Transcript_24514/g.58094 Transcript_24514/m.58094 type:complete len:192 (+) Transcript_24514:103-678(+)
MGMRWQSALLVALALLEEASATLTTQGLPASMGAMAVVVVLGLLQACLLCGFAAYAWHVYRLWRSVKPQGEAAPDATAPVPKRSRPPRGVSASSQSSCGSIGAERHADKLTPSKYRGLIDMSPTPNIARTMSSCSTDSPKPSDWPRPGSMLACNTCTKGALKQEGGVHMTLARFFCAAGDKQVPLETALAP